MCEVERIILITDQYYDVYVIRVQERPYLWGDL